MNPPVHTTTSVLRYSRSRSGGYRLVAEIDRELARYYRALIPKWITVNVPMYPPHVTVVRTERETPAELGYWGRYEGEAVELAYEAFVYSSETYFWLNFFSDRLERIRAELGLPVTSIYTRPPDGFRKVFHSTVANCK